METNFTKANTNNEISFYSYLKIDNSFRLQIQLANLLLKMISSYFHVLYLLILTFLFNLVIKTAHGEINSPRNINFFNKRKGKHEEYYII